MKFYSSIRKYPLIRLLFYFIFGIIITYNFQDYLINRSGVFLSITCFGSILLIITSGFNRLNFLFDYIAPHIFISFSIFLTLINFSPPSISPEENIWHGIIYEIPSEKENSVLIPVQLSNKSFKSPVFQKPQHIFLYSSKEILENKNLKSGNLIIFNTSLNRIKNFGNPHEFDYAKYMAINGVFLQGYAKAEDIILLNSERTSFNTIISGLRKRSEKTFNKFIKNQDALAIANALTLGNKQYLSNDLKQSFINSGAIHVLAVSGLHVGIIYLFINYLLNILVRSSKLQLAKICITIIIIWLYASLTGFSPSVCRAALMFTLIGVAKTFNRDISYYNILAFAALILLVINPLMLFNIGFQLSFIAVGGIVFYQPLLFNLFTFKYGIFNSIYQLLTISIAAQLITTPISLFYFHQFPTYFWLTNLLLIPLVFISIVLAIILLAFGWLEAIATIIGLILNSCLNTTHLWVTFIESLPLSTLKNVHITGITLALLFLILLFSTRWILTKRPIQLIYAISCIILTLTLSTIKKYKTHPTNELIVYNQPHSSYIGIYSTNSNYLLYSNTKEKHNKILDYYLSKHWSKQNLSSKVQVVNIDSTIRESNHQSANKLINLILPNEKIFSICNNKVDDKLIIPTSDYFFVNKSIWPPNITISTHTIILNNTLYPNQRRAWNDYATMHQIELIDLVNFGAYRILWD